MVGNCNRARCVGVIGKFRATIGVAILALGFGGPAQAHIVTLFGTDVKFTFDEHTLFGGGTVTGNALDFSPTDFLAESLDGAATLPAPPPAGGTSTVTQTLIITVEQTNLSYEMAQFFLAEDGDYKLKSVAPSPDASVAADAFFTVESLTKNCPLLACEETKIFSAGAFADTGGASALWSLGGSIDLADTVDWGTDTKVNITLQNNLTAFTADNGEIAFIQKKDGDIGIVVMPSVPVPAAVWLFGSGLVGLAGIARVRRGKKAA